MHHCLSPIAAATILLCSTCAGAQAQLKPVEVIATTPLPGIELPKEQVPANTQQATAADLERLQAADLASFLVRSAASVSANGMQGNPLQLDLHYRGFTASPLLGTPQGLSVYLDGVRLNQPFGDVVSWDLIPRTAIASLAVMPGSNPLFGLNTLGGALAVQSKDGKAFPGTSLQALAGSHGRRAVEFETGGHRADGLHWYGAAHRFHEDGWRTASPSDLGQLFGKLGRRDADGDISLTAALAGTHLAGNGLQEQAALQRDWRSVYTTPDATRNRAAFLNLALLRDLGDDLTFTANAYWRRIRTRTLNGDINDEALAESVYQPGAAERAALAAAGYGGFPRSGANAANTPFPRWRCIANVLTNAEPNEKCNGLLNRTATAQGNAGFAAHWNLQRSLAGRVHNAVAGIAWDASRVRFSQATQFGFIRPDRSVEGVDGPGAFADGSQDSENAFDARVALRSRSHTASLLASDTIELGRGTHLTLAGRYDRTVVDNRDGITPGGGPGSLDGRHRFGRLNPGLGLTHSPSPSLNLYAGLNQGSRAPTAIELGCADPASPCKLPNSFAGDPPLRMVVTTTFEAGVRGRAGEALEWNVGVFRADNRDDLLFVAGDTSGYGYFRNFGKTRRQGLELGLAARPAAGWRLGANLSLLDATFRSAETVGGAGNSSNDAAQAGFPGTEGTIAIRPGDRIPLLARRTLKLTAEWQAHPQWRLALDLQAAAAANLRGNENGRHQADGVFYTGAGRTPGYAVLNLGVDWQPEPALKVFVQVNNLLDRRYTTGGQLGASGFDANGNYAARPLPRDANGDHPVPRASFLAPGAPRSAWVGLRYRFG